MNKSRTPTDRTDDRIESLFGVLRARERRRIVVQLLEAGLTTDDPVAVRTAVPAAHTESFAIRLHHQHLPRLAEAGYVEWDRENDLLRAGETYDELATFVEFLRANEARLPGDWV